MARFHSKLVSEFPLTFFPAPAAWRAWLKANHRSATAIVLQLRKVHVSRGVTYAEALDEALCFGWIDGVRRAHDADHFTVRFTPRKKGSIWSLVNVRHVERLIAAKRMTATGLQVFQARQAHRTGIYSFEQARPVTLAPALQKRFQANKAAWAWYQASAPYYRRTSAFWVMSAKKDETRERRLATLIACSAEGLKIPPLRRP